MAVANNIHHSSNKVLVLGFEGAIWDLYDRP